MARIRPAAGGFAGPYRGLLGGVLPAYRGNTMAGLFELFVDEQSQFRFRLLDGRGVTVAESSSFDDKSGAVAGIDAVRECAGTGLVADLSDHDPDA